MAIKKQLGKLPLPEPVASYIARHLDAQDLAAIAVSCEHAAAVETLDPLHRDPFDRLLIVQARYENMRLLTVDENVLAYGAPAVDARA